MPDCPPRVEVVRGGEDEGEGEGEGAPPLIPPRPVWRLGAEVSVPACGERFQSRKK